jgi:hypothetical protein
MTTSPPCRNCKWFRTGARVVCIESEFGRTFDVAFAEEIVRVLPRPVTIIYPSRLRRYISKENVNTRHLRHVDNSKPGIMGLYRHKGLHRFILEGSHRAYNSLLAGQSYAAYLLTEEETTLCIIEGE